VVFDMESLDAGLARLGTRRVMVTAVIVLRRMGDVGVVEVKPAQFVVVLCRAMNVRGPGDQAERQVQKTATQCHGPTHPAEPTGRLGLTPPDRSTRVGRRGLRRWCRSRESNPDEVSFGGF